MLTTDDKTLILFLARECEHQNCGPVAVANYVWAWEAMRSTLTRNRERRMNTPLTENWVINLATVIAPEVNGKYRSVPVTFRNGAHGLDHALIPRAMSNLLDSLQDEPARFYEEFERIHPFIDGNGRTGLMLYNYLINTMDKPSPAPKVNWNL